LVLAMNTSITDVADTDTLSIVALVFTVRRAQRPINCAYIAHIQCCVLVLVLGVSVRVLVLEAWDLFRVTTKPRNAEKIDE